MRCLLIVPPWDIQKYHGGRVDHPNGILHIGAVLKKMGHDIKFLDGAFFDHDTILSKTIDYKPDLIGVYVIPFLRQSALKFITNIKNRLKNVFIIVGGPDSTFFKEKYLEWCHELDCAVFGEGELTIQEIALKLEGKKSLKGIKGCCYRGKNGKIVVNPVREPISDLNSIPFPARDLLDFDKYHILFGHFKRKPSIGIMTARGCTNRCLFCYKVYPKNVDYIRYRSPKNIVDEIEECVNKYGVKDVRFWDDTFFSNEKRVFDICNEIKNRKLDIAWQCNARVDQVNSNILKKIKEAGCYCVLYGVESGVQKNIDKLKKNITLNQVKKAVKITKEAKLEVYTTFMFGIPNETFIDGLKTLKFAFDLKCDEYNFNYFTPYPGSDAYNQVSNLGGLVSNPKIMMELSFVPFTMTEFQIRLLKLLSKVLHKVDIYLRRPYSSATYYLKRVNSFRDFIDLIRIYTT